MASLALTWGRLWQAYVEELLKHAEDKHPFSPSVEALTQVSSDVNEEEMTPGMQEAQQVRGWRGIVRRDLVRRGLVRRGLVRSSL